jgi:hypothetical protein
MDRNLARLGWGDRATFIGLALTIIGFTWILHYEHCQDVRRAEEWYRQDKIITDQRFEKMEERLQKMDEKLDASLKVMDAKWEHLFEKYFESKR